MSDDGDKRFAYNKPCNCRPQGHLYDRLDSLMKHEVTSNICYDFSTMTIQLKLKRHTLLVCIGTGLEYFEYFNGRALLDSRKYKLVLVKEAVNKKRESVKLTRILEDLHKVGRILKGKK